MYYLSTQQHYAPSTQHHVVAACALDRSLDLCFCLVELAWSSDDISSLPFMVDGAAADAGEGAAWVHVCLHGDVV